MVVEGDDHPVWAYVVSHTEKSMGFEFDGFICSRGTLVDSDIEAKKYIDQSYAPILMKEYSNEHSIQSDLTNKDIRINRSGNEISVELKGVEFLIMDLKNRQSYSKSTKMRGPNGIPLDEKTKHNNEYNSPVYQSPETIAFGDGSKAKITAKAFVTHYQSLSNMIYKWAK